MIVWLMRRYLRDRRALLMCGIFTLPTIGVPEITPLLAVPLLPIIWLLFPARVMYYEAALPFSGRQLLVARLLSMHLLVLLPVLAGIAAAMVSGGALVSPIWYVALLAGLSIALSASHLLQAHSMIAAGWSQVVPLWLAVGVCATLMAWALPGPVAVTLLVLALVLVTYCVFSRVPESLQLTSLELIDVDDDAQGAHCGWNHPTRVVPSWMWPLVRSRRVNVVIVLGLISVILGSLSLSPTMYMMVLIVIPLHLRPIPGWIPALPLSHRARCLFVYLPVLLGTAGAVTLGRSLPSPFGRLTRGMYFDAPYTPSDSGYFSSKTRITLEHWTRVRTGTVPIVTAPWGETAAAYTVTLPGLLLANPYSSREANSERFVAWQFGRATAAYYGRAMTLEEYDDDDVARPLPRTRQGTMPLLALAGIWIIALAQFLLDETARWHRFARPSRWRWTGSWLQYAPLWAMLLIDMYGTFRYDGLHLITPLASWTLLRIHKWMPANDTLVFLLAFTPVVLLYLLLERQFARAEVVPPRAAG